MNKKQIGFGIIGCGVVANVHVKAIRAIEGATLIGVAGATPEEAKRFAFENDTRAFSDIDTLLEEDEIKVVCICTPSGLHEAQAIQAAKAGKHVIIEKPLALTPEGAEEIIKACKENRVKGTVISQLRFSDAIRRTKKAIDENRLGKIVMANLSMKYYRSTEYYSGSNWRGTWAMDGGGALMNQGIHGVDELVYLLGAPKTIFGNARTLSRNIETEDNAVACFTFGNGAVGTLCASTAVYPGFDRLLEIHGDRGSVVIREDKIETWNIIGEEKKEISLSASNMANDPKAVNPGGHTMQILDFLACIKEDKKPLVSLEDGKTAVEIITSVYKSSNSEQIVRMS